MEKLKEFTFYDFQATLIKDPSFRLLNFMQKNGIRLISLYSDKRTFLDFTHYWIAGNRIHSAYFQLQPELPLYSLEESQFLYQLLAFLKMNTGYICRKPDQEKKPKFYLVEVEDLDSILSATDLLKPKLKPILSHNFKF